MVINNYEKEKQEHEAKVQGLLNYKAKVKQKKEEAALAAKQAEEKMARLLKEQEEVAKRVAALKKSRKAPEVDPQRASSREYAEGWEVGVTRAYEWLDRVEQRAKGKGIEQYLKENPLAIAEAEEELHALRNDALLLQRQSMQVLDGLVRRGITIGRRHPDAAAADRRCSYAQAKAGGYAAVVFPVFQSAKDGE